METFEYRIIELPKGGYQIQKYVGGYNNHWYTLGRDGHEWYTQEYASTFWTLWGAKWKLRRIIKSLEKKEKLKVEKEKARETYGVVYTKSVPSTKK